MKTETYEITVLIPSPLTVGIGLALIYLLGVWIYDLKTKDNNGWFFRSSDRWWAWVWPVVIVTLLYIAAYVTVSDYFERRR
jgi:hypothetical protein